MLPIGRLNDISWKLLDWLDDHRIPIGRFFDDHNLPPFLFLLLILAVLIPTVVIISSPVPQPQPVCGDSICDPGENATSCPADCVPSEPQGKTVVVEIEGDIKGVIKVELEDSGGRLISTDSGKTDTFTITGVESKRVRAVVTNPDNNKDVESDLIDVVDDPQVIPIGLPPGFFEKEKKPTAVLRVQLRDAKTKSPISGRVSVVIPSGASYIVAETKRLTASARFVLEAGQRYAILASADNYHSYDGLKKDFILAPGEEREITVELEEIGEEDAMVHVCILNASQAVPGSVRVYNEAGSVVAFKHLSSGCGDLVLKPGTIARFETFNLSGSCKGAVSPPVYLNPGNNSITLNVVCRSSGYIRVRVLGEGGEVLTQRASITAWYASGEQISATGPNNTLLPGEGNYTEYAEVVSSKKFYFVVTGLENYTTYTSPEFSVAPLENKSITLTLSYPPAPDPVITILFSYPNPVSVAHPFSVVVSGVLYGDTAIENANISVVVAGEECERSGRKFICLAPEEPGLYNLLISAVYNGKQGVYLEDLQVLEVGMNLFSLRPRPLGDQDPPIHMEFDIMFNSTPLDSLTDSTISIIYRNGGIQLPEHPRLSGSNGLYDVDINTPYPGNHLLNIYLKKIIYDKIYEQVFVVPFVSSPRTLHLSSETILTPRILLPKRTFTAYLKLKYGKTESQNLTNIYLTLNSIRSRIPWSPSTHSYSRSFAAPEYEGIYPVAFDISGTPLASSKIYVVDISRERSRDCPIMSCKTMQDVRRCVERHEKEGMYTEDDLIRCIESGWLVGGTSIGHCLSTDSNKGDWNHNCELDSTGRLSDVAIMEDFFRKITNPVERDEYKGCGDMDNDGDVDKDDLTCLQNIVSGRWYGDTKGNTSRGGCEGGSMNGGFCFDISTTRPGDFDNDGTIGPADLRIMDKILDAISSGVSPLPLLKFADFNQDGSITKADRGCMKYIGQNQSIPLSCLAVYNLGCSNDTKGDLDMNNQVDEADLFLESLLVNGRVDASGLMYCADMNNDGILTDEDMSCLQGLINGDPSLLELCTACQKRMRDLGRYGEEICHDGLDNNCDDKIDDEDPRCKCSEKTPCDMKRDIDGAYDTDDFMICRYLECPDEEGDWAWRLPEEVEEACQTAENFKCIQRCGSGEEAEEFICSPDYPQGFKCPDTVEEFTWVEGTAGIIGPLCVLHDCGSQPSCPDGWVKVGVKEGTCCERGFLGMGCKAHDHCTLCRYQYDFCEGRTCGKSGDNPKLDECKSGWEKYTESCPKKTFCFGNLAEEMEKAGQS